MSEEKDNIFEKISQQEQVLKQIKDLSEEFNSLMIEFSKNCQKILNQKDNCERMLAALRI
ncbi:hypothetical protein LCGC14_1792070 [marine sediment metagenome]|uniref:Uncharacterized protein n=1 Tax=marine sediment metagenome TaxID=412755 RepID=A0A0F9HET8_9ZZZZ